MRPRSVRRSYRLFNQQASFSNHCKRLRIDHTAQMKKHEWLALSLFHRFDHRENEAPHLLQLDTYASSSIQNSPSSIVYHTFNIVKRSCEVSTNHIGLFFLNVLFTSLERQKRQFTKKWIQNSWFLLKIRTKCSFYYFTQTQHPLWHAIDHT